MLTEVVVFPVPPLWLKMARRRGRVDARVARGASSDGRRTGARRGLGDGRRRAPGATASTGGGCGRGARWRRAARPPASARTCVRHSSEHACRSSPFGRARPARRARRRSACCTRRRSRRRSSPRAPPSRGTPASRRRRSRRPAPPSGSGTAPRTASPQTLQLSVIPAIVHLPQVATRRAREGQESRAHSAVRGGLAGRRRTATSRCARDSVPEVAHAGEHHRDAEPSAAAMTSASFTLPPGCATAVTPALAAASTPSGNGKNASRREHAPARALARLLARDLHRDDARHLPRADADRRAPRARARSRSTSRACRRARRTRGSRSSSAVGARFVATLPRVTSPAAVASRSAPRGRRRRACTVSAAWSAPSQPPVARRRRFFFARSISSAAAAKRRRDDALEERLGEELGGRLVDLAVQRDDAAERAQRRRPRAPSRYASASDVARRRRRTGSCA